MEMGSELIIALSAILGICLGVLIIFFVSKKEKRAYKDQASNFSRGNKSTVTVYDINGNVIKQYSGEFDVETGNTDYILLDDENSKRHVIYYTATGTIIIDEE